MGNAAGVAFYEHLFDGRKDQWAEVIPWLSPFVVRQCWGLWEDRLSGKQQRRLRRLMRELGRDI